MLIRDILTKEEKKSNRRTVSENVKEYTKLKAFISNTPVFPGVIFLSRDESNVSGIDDGDRLMAGHAEPTD